MVSNRLHDQRPLSTREIETHVGEDLTRRRKRFALAEDCTFNPFAISH